MTDITIPETETALGQLIRSVHPGEHYIKLRTESEVMHGQAPKVNYGDYVRITTNKQYDLVGVISNIISIDASEGKFNSLYNSDILNELFDSSLGEKTTLLQITIIGSTGPTHSLHEFPVIALDLASHAFAMTTEEIKRFHTIEGKTQMGYYKNLADNPKISKDILRSLLQTLRKAYHDDPTTVTIIDVLLEA